MRGYKVHTLESIKLADFIEVFLGDTGRVLIEGEADAVTLSREAARLCQQYISIVGGKAVASEVVRRNDILKIEMRTKVLDVVRVCMAVEDWQGASQTLGAIGYKIDPGNRQAIRQRVEALSATDRYQLDRMRKAVKDVEIDRSYFVRERVTVMQYAKMYIDPEQFTAAEYAWMVKGMCDAYNRIKQQKETSKTRK